MGQRIDIDAVDGSGAFGAYLSPLPAQPGPGIVMLHEILGITLWIEEVADQFTRVDTAWSHPTCSGGWNPDLLPITGFGRARKRHALSRRDQAR